jgi:hypothetical protein
MRGAAWEVARDNTSAQISRLLPELRAWRPELAADIERAEQRGFRHLAADLRRLQGRVDAVLEAARAG